MDNPAQTLTEQAAWEHILLQHASRYPLWGLADAYKLAFQAALGSEHAAPSEAAARQWLEREIASIGEGPEEPAIDAISPDGRIARVHLRPYLAQGGSLDALLDTFLRTAAIWQGNRETLRHYLDLVVDLAQADQLAFLPGEACAYFQQLEASGFPPAHHSPTYRDLYRPAYRVILQPLLPLSPAP